MSPFGLRPVSSFRTRFRAVTTSELVRDVAKLVTGTAGGRLIALAALPIATRLYSPEDFATLATYLGVVSIVAVVACLRLDIAIPLAKTDDDAANLLVLALFSALGVSAFSLALTILVPTELSKVLGRPDLAPHLWLLPLGVFMTASYSAFQFWATRARRFGIIAWTRITQAAMGVGLLVGLGWAGVAPFGLLMGTMISSSAGSLRLGLEAWRRDGQVLKVVSIPAMRATLKRNRRYPIYSMPEALANTAGIHLPVILLAAFAGAETGFLLLAMQIMNTPTNLLGSSIAQVYMSRAPQEMQAGRLDTFTLQMVHRLIQIGVGPLIFTGLLAPLIFPLVFGTEWSRAGQIVAWLTPWMILKLVGSSISMVLHQTGRQHWAMALQVVGLVMRVGAVIVAGLWFPSAAVPAIAVAAAAFYAIYLVVNLCAAGISPTAAIWTIAKGLTVSIPWIVAGIVVHWLVVLAL